MINIGEQGKNGTVVVTLFKANSPTGQINGTLSQGNITSDMLQGNLDNKQVSDSNKSYAERTTLCEHSYSAKSGRRGPRTNRICRRG